MRRYASAFMDASSWNNWPGLCQFVPFWWRQSWEVPGQWLCWVSGTVTHYTVTQCSEAFAWTSSLITFFLQNTFLFRPWVYGQHSVINKRKTWKLIFCWYGHQVIFQEEDFLWVSGIGFHPVFKLEVWKHDLIIRQHLHLGVLILPVL